jgi:cell division septation protein DedD
LRRLALVAMLCGAAAASADGTASMFAARRASESYALTVRESRTVQVPGATAAWAIDANVVDVAARNGSVTLFGRAAGRTKVIVVSAAGESAFEVVVDAKRGGAIDSARQAKTDFGVAEVRYSSAARELQNSVTVTRETKTRKTEVHVRTAHVAQQPVGDRARTSIPSASIRFFTPARELTLFDRDVDHSPLTLSRTPVRGVHYLDEHWRLHAGYTAYATYLSFLIPVDRQLVAGAGYAIRLGTQSSITPSVFLYRGEGSVLSVMYDYDDRERLAYRAELGYSRGLGAAAQLAYGTERDQVRADVRYRADGFAVASPGAPRGLLADGSWHHQYRQNSTAALSFAATDFADTRVVAGTADVEHRLSERFALTGGVAVGSFNGARNISIPAGFRLDFARGGIAALYRYSESEKNEGGHGFRVTARRSFGRLFASGYVDRQQNAPTLDVIFGEYPELALALGELGITATSPADIARALRENAALLELGYIEGVTVDLAPMRTQLGLELAWLGTTASRQQLRARLLRSVTESVASRSASTIATLTYSRRLTGSTDLFAGYTYWSTERRGEEPRNTPFVELGVRQRFDGLPSLLGGSGGNISGVVFADEDLDGVSDGTTVAAEVELDGADRKATKADGTFIFTNVARGTHRVSARIPNRPDAYFTTPSRVEVEAGSKDLAFGVASTPARLQGRVASDAGSGIGGVRLLLARGSQQVIATTESDGEYSVAAAPGEWQVSILTDSVPAGYSLSGTEARAVQLERAQPRTADYTLRAHRTVAGAGAPANAEIEVRSLGRTIRADEQGRFSIRSLPPGEVTVIAGGVEHRVVIPAGPATVTLDVSPRIAAAAPEVRTEVRGERRDTMRGYVVALGAFRVHANAVETAARARKHGVVATLDGSGALTIVRSGPYQSHGEATAAAGKLTAAGMEAVVLSTK